MAVQISPRENVTVGLISEVKAKLRELGATKITVHIK